MLMILLSVLYAKYHVVPKIISLFNGLQVVVVALVANATYSFGKTTFKAHKDIILAIAASSLFWAGISPFLVIAGAAIAGLGLPKAIETRPFHAHNHKIGSRSVKNVIQ